MNSMNKCCEYFFNKKRDLNLNINFMTMDGRKASYRKARKLILNDTLSTPIKFCLLFCCCPPVNYEIEFVCKVATTTYLYSIIARKPCNNQRLSEQQSKWYMPFKIVNKEKTANQARKYNNSFPNVIQINVNR